MDNDLRLLKQEFERYFPDSSDNELPKLKMPGNLFCLKKDILSEDLWEEFLEIKCHSNAKSNFSAMSLTDFWAKYVHIYKRVGAVATNTPSVFIELHVQKWLFFLSIKTKRSNKFECEADLKGIIWYKVTN